MLHALLRRKLHPSIPEPERLEDALTSAVFGPLLWSTEWSLLCAWFGNNVASGDSKNNRYWFWPRLELAEPDLVIRVGDRLFVVEAKFGSGRHDLVIDDGDEDSISDQIVRQYQSIRAPRSERLNYDAPLERAIEECDLSQIIVVDARRLKRARREYEESKAALPEGAALRLVTWQQLYSGLLLLPERADWVADLLAYMELVGLDSFNGIGHGLHITNGISHLRWWRAPGASGPGLTAAFAGIRIDDAIALHKWGRAGRIRGQGYNHRTWASDAQRALMVLAWGK